MKKKNLLQTIMLIMIFLMMNQFANAQTCSTGKVWACRCWHHTFECKCVNVNNLSQWLAQGSGNCSMVRLTNRTESTVSFLNVYPNPVSNSTAISFFLDQSQNVSLKLFDLNGRMVATIADKIFKEGENEIVWNACDMNAGIYFLQLQSAENLQTEKLIVTK